MLQYVLCTLVCFNDNLACFALFYVQCTCTCLVTRFEASEEATEMIYHEDGASAAAAAAAVAVCTEIYSRESFKLLYVSCILVCLDYKAFLLCFMCSVHVRTLRRFLRLRKKLQRLSITTMVVVLLLPLSLLLIMMVVVMLLMSVISLKNDDTRKQTYAATYY